MKIKDTLTHNLVELKPIHSGRINLFVCGPTVYNYIHVGNGRLFVVFDSFARFLREEGYEVFYLQNITDIDDKIFRKASEDGTSWDAVAKKFVGEFLADMKSVGVESVTFYAKATAYIEQIIEQISTLMRKGYAYETNDGVYYDVTKFKDYGKLSGQDLEMTQAGARVEVNEDKRNAADFVLWKKMKPGEPYWDSPWGKGRPGWHIEDTAISEAFFGAEYDIHGGGSDLIFPHHEAEIAQMRAISGKKHLSRYWMHVSMLIMDKEKMSKSLGNIVRLRDAVEKYGPETFRFFVLNSSFDSLLSYSDEAMKAAGETVSRIGESYRKVRSCRGSGPGSGLDFSVRREAFREKLRNGFDTHGALTEVMSTVTEINRTLDRFNSGEVKDALSYFSLVNSIMGILKENLSPSGSKLIENLLKARKEARLAGNYQFSDTIRKILEDSGVSIQDNGPETEWWYS